MGIWLLYSKRGGGNFLVSGHVLRILCATGAGDDDEDTGDDDGDVLSDEESERKMPTRFHTDEYLEDNGGVPCAYLR